MLICSGCSQPWEEVGNEYKRLKEDKVDYWCASCRTKRKPREIEFARGGIIDAEKSYKKDRQYRFPNPSEVIERSQPENILVVGDLHLPFTLEGYFEFCLGIYKKYNCDHVIFIGDLIDSHFSSFHATDPDGMSAGTELDYAIEMLKPWKEAFPVADVCHGNHDLIQLRKAYKEGLSKRWIKDFGEVLDVDWNFQPSFEYNGCLFRHGLGMKAAPKSGSEMMNVIQGHFHTDAYMHWNVGRGKKVFGMQVGCGVDRESYAMAYAKEFPKQAISCGVVLEYGRLPVIEMMEL